MNSETIKKVTNSKPIPTTKNTKKTLKITRNKQHPPPKQTRLKKGQRKRPINRESARADGRDKVNGPARDTRGRY